jgi:hypothetical protein
VLIATSDSRNRALAEIQTSDQGLSEFRAFRRLPAGAQQITAYKLRKLLINNKVLFGAP